MARNGRAVRLTALALATGTLVATGTGTAGAATAPDRQMQATGTGAALTLTLNLPPALASALKLPETLEQSISMTDGKVSTVGGVTGVTTALLGKGNAPVLSDVLAKSTKAALDGQAVETTSAFTVNQPGLKLEILPLSSKVANPTATTKGVLAQSTSGVARVAIGGVALPTVVNDLTAPLVDTLEGALGAKGTTGQATGTVTDAVNTALDSLNGLTQDKSAPLTAPVADAVNDAVTDLTGKLDSLTDTLGSLNAATELVTLDSVISNQVISRDGAAVTSAVDNTVKNISVLNGLVKVQALSSQAVATAGGVAGSAKASTVAPVLKVDVAEGALTALLDEKGLNVGGTVGNALPDAVEQQVNNAVTQVNGLLNTVAGVDVAIGKGATSAAPDGTAAAADVAATVLTVDPPALHTAGLLPAGKKFLQIKLVSAQAAVANRVPPAAPVQPTVTKSLPRTGGELPLTGAVATVLVGVALIARRRRVAEIG